MAEEDPKVEQLEAEVRRNDLELIKSTVYLGRTSWLTLCASLSLFIVFFVSRTLTTNRKPPTKRWRRTWMRYVIEIRR